MANARETVKIRPAGQTGLKASSPQISHLLIVYVEY